MHFKRSQRRTEDLFSKIEEDKNLSYFLEEYKLKNQYNQIGIALVGLGVSMVGSGINICMGGAPHVGGVIAAIGGGITLIFEFYVEYQEDEIEKHINRIKRGEEEEFNGDIYRKRGTDTYVFVPEVKLYNGGVCEA